VSIAEEYKKTPKRMYFLRACPLFFSVLDAFTDRVNASRSAVFKNAIKYCIDNEISLHSVDIFNVFRYLMDHFHIVVASVELAMISCVKPESRVYTYERTSIQLEEELLQSISERAKKEGLSLSDAMRRAVLYYISEKLKNEATDAGNDEK